MYVVCHIAHMDVIRMSYRYSNHFCSVDITYIIIITHSSYLCTTQVMLYSVHVPIVPYNINTHGPDCGHID